MSGLEDSIPGAIPTHAVPQEDVQTPKPEAPLSPSGVETIGLLRTKTERGGYFLDSTRNELEKDLQREVPSQPDAFVYTLLFNAGQSEEEARNLATHSAQRAYLYRKANAQAALDYLRTLDTSDADFESMAYLSEAIVTYNRQFNEMGRLLGIDLDQLSRLDSTLTIKEVYRRNLTPIPERLAGIFFDEGTQATARYRPIWNGKTVNKINLFFSPLPALGWLPLN